MIIIRKNTETRHGFKQMNLNKIRVLCCDFYSSTVSDVLAYFQLILTVTRVGRVTLKIHCSYNYQLPQSDKKMSDKIEIKFTFKLP